MEKTLRQQSSTCLKIVLFGPESTGKTTMAKQLAKHFNTLWVPEYMREYLQQKWDAEGVKCTMDDLMPIAEGQMHVENESAKLVDELLICDTNLLEISVYSQYYYNGFCPGQIKKYAKENTYDLYFLTSVDVPWEIDDLRDRPNERQKMFRTFEAVLKDYDLHYEVLEGSEIERFESAVKKVIKLLKEKQECSQKPI
jgi:HTH-type transcriptional repressor of NAD biosynthesis genes